MLEIIKTEAEEQQIKRGYIYHVSECKFHIDNSIGSEMWSNRPAVVISNNLINKYSNCVSIIYLTTMTKSSYKPRPSHVSVMSNNKEAVALCDQIYTVDKLRLDYLIGEVDEETIREIDIALAATYSIAGNKVTSDIVHGFFTKWSQYVEKNKLYYPNENEILHNQIKKLVETNIPTIEQKQIRHKLEHNLTKEITKNQRLEIQIDKKKEELNKSQINEAKLTREVLKLELENEELDLENQKIKKNDEKLNYTNKMLDKENQLLKIKYKKLSEELKEVSFDVKNLRKDNLNLYEQNIKLAMSSSQELIRNKSKLPSSNRYEFDIE